MRWNRLVAISAGTALLLSVLTTLAPAALATGSDGTGSPDATTPIATSGTGSENAATAPAPAQPPGPMSSVDELEAQMLSMVNAERAAVGVGAVQQVSWAHSVAQQHSQDMAAAGDIWHNVAGYMNHGHAAMGATYLGENVAMDSTLAAGDALLYSDIPHRNVTLDGRFNSVGIGIALDSKNWVYITEDFAQIPGGTAPKAVAAITKPVVTQAPPLATAAAVKPPVKAPVARAPVAVATVKPAPIKAQVVAAPAPAVAAAVVAPPAPAPAVPAVKAPAAPPAQPVQVISTKSVSHATATKGGVWMLLGLMGLVMVALSARRFVSVLRHARKERPVATAYSLGSPAGSRRTWKRAA